MSKFLRLLAVVTIICVSVFTYDLICDYQQLHRNVIRIHVVANSDTEIDQQQKLLVRDAVIEYLQSGIDNCTNKKDAQAYITSKLGQVELVAENTLSTLGSKDTATVTLQEEPFDKRVYDTFTLPAGIYTSLRIEIGEGEGKNWWCVVFPSLCFAQDKADFAHMATGAGFSQRILKTIENSEEYEVRFYLLDLIGKAKKFLKRII